MGSNQLTNLRENDPHLAFLDVEHPLTDVLSLAGFQQDTNRSIVSLKPQTNQDEKSAIYKLGIRHCQLDWIVAKRSLKESAEVERTIYETVLPQLPVTTPRYLGYVQEPSERYGWLFLEYVDGVPFLRDSKAHQIAAAQWLGVLHTTAAFLPQLGTLPRRDEDHYRGHLRAASATLTRLTLDSNCTVIKGVLFRLLDKLQQVDEHWADLHVAIQNSPRTLVHGDFASKNIRVRASPQGLQVMPFDWETSGYGPPAPDLAGIDIKTYVAHVSGSRGASHQHEVTRLAAVGRVWRLLASLDWSSQTLAASWSERVASHLVVYDGRLETIIRDCCGKWSHDDF